MMQNTAALITAKILFERVLMEVGFGQVLTTDCRQRTKCVAYHDQLSGFASFMGIIPMIMTFDSLDRSVGPLLAPVFT